ncbi:MAG: hypothetical protein WCR20_13265 [Verrucomicrobiota bacterium]
MEDQAQYGNQRGVLEVAQMIQRKIQELEQERPKLLDQAQAKAQAISNYDRALAIAILKIKNGTITQLDGEEIKGLAQNLIPYIAKGLCYSECFDKEVHENGYKAILSNIDCIRAEMNGLQSINRNLSEV